MTSSDAAAEAGAGAGESTKPRWNVERTRIDAPILLDLAALAAYPIVRTLNDGTVTGAWTLAVLILAIRWPASGLGLVVAIMVLPMPARIALVAASAIGFALDLARHGVPDGAMRRRLLIVVAGVITLAAATLVALLRSLVRLDPEFAVLAARRWIEFGAGFAFLLMLLRAFSMGSTRPLVLGLIGIIVGLVVSLVEFLAPGLTQSIGMRWLAPGADSSRASGPFIGPNRLGIVAGIMAIVGACQALMTERRRWLWAALTVLAAAALVASFSRGALLGLIVAGGAILAIRSRRLAAGYFAAAILIAVIAVPLYVAARLAGSGATVDELLSNDQGRFDAWLAGIRMILAEPIFGQGFHSFPQLGESFGATDGLQTSHNEFIGLWAGSGVAAIVAYVAIVVGVVESALERRHDSWAMVAIGALALFLVAVSFSDASNFLAVTGPLWLIVAYGIARPLDRASPERPRQG